MLPAWNNSSSSTFFTFFNSVPNQNKLKQRSYFFSFTPLHNIYFSPLILQYLGQNFVQFLCKNAALKAINILMKIGRREDSSYPRNKASVRCMLHYIKKNSFLRNIWGKVGIFNFVWLITWPYAAPCDFLV